TRCDCHPSPQGISWQGIVDFLAARPGKRVYSNPLPVGDASVKRDALKTQILSDRIEYLLVQFVDIHGAAKVKMVPHEALDDVADVGAGFAGGAVWGMGQNAASHDMLARIDADSYTPLPWRPGLARFASDLHVDGKPHAYCPRVNLKRVLGELRAAG